MRSARAPGRKNRRKLWWLLAIPGLFAAVVGIGAFRIMQASGGVGGVKAFTDPMGEFPGQHRMIILIAGKDYNHDAKTGAEYTKGSRSDTVMLVSADLDTKTLAAVGIPRDTHVIAPDGQSGKINGTFARGGIKLLSQTITDTFGLHPDHYVVLKADAVKAIVDALGGVDVETIDRMYYYDFWDHLLIDLPAGRQHVNGEQAAGFVRFRKSGDHKPGPNMEPIPTVRIPSKEEGDIRRMQRQQQLIHAMLAQVMKPSNFLQLGHIIDVSFNQVETDLSRPQLVALAQIFKDSSRTGLDGATIPGKDAKIGDTYYWQADIARSKLMLSWILNGDPQAGRRLTRVVVYGSRSQAQDDADRLKEAGFTARAERLPRTGVTDTEVVYHTAAFEGMARDIASALGIQNVRKEPIQAGAFWLPEVKVNLVPATARVFSPHVGNDRVAKL